MGNSVRLGDVARIKHGYAFSGEHFRDEPPGDFLVTPGNFRIGGGFSHTKAKFYNGPNVDGFFLKTGDLIVTMTDLSKAADTLGFPAVVPKPAGPYRFLHNQRIGLVEITSPGLDKRYLYYLLTSAPYRAEILASATGTTVKHTSPSRIEAFRFDLPSIAGQREISSALGALDDKIELNRKMSETLEAMARALFKSWFVDFDPVCAKAEGRDPGLPAEIAAFFPDSFEESELGKIPKGWRIEHVGSIANVNRLTISPTAYPDETFYHYSLPAFDDRRFPSRQTGSEIQSNKFLVPRDSVLLSRLNPRTPRVWMPEVDGVLRSICSTEFAVMTPNIFSRELLYCLFLSSNFCGFFATMVTGTSGSHQRVKPDSLAKMPVVSSPNSVAERFTDFAGPILSRAQHCLNESQILATLRDTLLPKLISGEIRVTDAERIVEQTA